MKTVTVVVAIESDGRGGEDVIARSFVFNGRLEQHYAITRAEKAMTDWIWADSKKDDPEATREDAAYHLDEFFHFMYSTTKMEDA